MDLRVPISFHCTVIERRKRNESTIGCAEWVDVSIPSLDDTDAPVATQWKDKDGKLCQTRWFNDKHWKPLFRRDIDGGPIGPCSIDDLQSSLETGKDDNHLSVGFERLNKGLATDTIPEFEPSNFREVISTVEREAAIEKLMERTADTIIVDGMVWVATPEPVYIKEYERSHDPNKDGEMHLRVVFLGEYHHGRSRTSDARNCYRLDRADELKEEFDNLELSLLSRKKTSLRIDSKATIFLPSSIKYEDEIEAFLYISGKCVESKKEDLSRDWVSTSDIRLWCDLSDAFAVAVETRDENSLMNLEKAAEAYVTSLSKQGSSYFDGELETSLKRWKSRPISNDINFSI